MPRPLARAWTAVSALLIQIVAAQMDRAWAASSLPDACPCAEDTVGNGFCDQKCFIAQCYFDAGDCGLPEGCPSDCSRFSLGNRICDSECLSEACLYDGGDCVPNLPIGTLNLTQWEPFEGRIGDCSEDNCRESWIDDGICDLTCNVLACDFDGTDCLPSKSNDGAEGSEPQSWCSEQVCIPMWIGNGYCDHECNTAACSFDGGDCDYDSQPSGAAVLLSPDLCAPGCLKASVGDGICNPACRNAATCQHDENDCLQSFLQPTHANNADESAIRSISDPQAHQSEEPDVMQALVFVILGLATPVFALAAFCFHRHLKQRKKANDILAAQTKSLAMTDMQNLETFVSSHPVRISLT